MNLAGDYHCRFCYANSFQSLQSASSRGCLGTVFGIIFLICGVISLFVPPFIWCIIPIAIGVALLKASGLNAKEKRISYERQATELLSSIAQSQQKEADACYSSGMEAFTSGSFKDAASAFERAYKTGRIDGQNMFMWVSSLYNQGELERCIPTLKGLMDGENPPDGTSELLARVYLRKGLSSTEQVSFLLRNQRQYSRSLQIDITLSCAKFCELNCCFFSEAIPLYDLANKLEPATLAHLKALLECAVRDEKWQEGKAYGARLPLDKLDAESISLYARCLCNLMDISTSAVEAYQRCLQHQPGDTDFRLRCVQAFISQKQLSVAERLLENGVAVDGNNCRIRYHLALVHMMVGRIQDCIGELQNVLRMTDFESYRSKEEIYILLARCFVRMGMLEAAMKQFLLAGRGEKHLDDLYGLGLKFEGIGDQRNARACWEEVYATDIRFKDVATRIGGVSATTPA
jgi:tetratricopeptide (TPR) repeat protein